MPSAVLAKCKGALMTLMASAIPYFVKSIVMFKSRGYAGTQTAYTSRAVDKVISVCLLLPVLPPPTAALWLEDNTSFSFNTTCRMGRQRFAVTKFQHSHRKEVSVRGTEKNYVYRHKLASFPRKIKKAEDSVTWSGNSRVQK